MATNGRPPEFKSAPPAVRTVKSSKNNRSCMLVVMIVIAFAAMLVATYMVLDKMGAKSFENDPYIRANQKYELALRKFEQGKLKDSAVLMKEVLDLQKLPEEERKTGKPDIKANAVTHNAAAILAVLSVKTGDCASYWKYRKLTREIAAQDWTFIIMDKRERMDDSDEKMLKKAKIVGDSAKRLVYLETACPTPDSRVNNKALLPAPAPKDGKDKKKENTSKERH